MKNIYSSLVILLFSASSVLACGPFYEPRYRAIPYIDSQQSSRANFGFLLRDYQLPPESYKRLDDRQYMADYIQSVKDVIHSSGREIYINLKASDLQETLCLGNTQEMAHQIRDQFQDTNMGQLARAQGGGRLFNAIQMVNSETINACGIFTDFANTDARMQEALTQLQNFSGPAPLQDFIWLILARMHTYTFNEILASQYIEKMNASEVAWIQQYAGELKDIGVHLKQHKMPQNLVLGNGSYYRRYGYGFGSGCGSNSVDSSLQYIRNLLDSSVSDAQVMALIKARDILLGNACVTMPEEANASFLSLTAVDESREIERIFAQYLVAAYHFYQGDYDAALILFEQLKQAQNTWIAETSSYLVGRTHLIKAQKDWNGYSLPEDIIKVDEVMAAEAAFSAHMQKYPGSRYQQSIAGLKRRIAYFKGDVKQLNLYLDEAINKAVENLQADKNQDNTKAFNAQFQEWRKYSDQSVDYQTAPFLMIAYDVMHAQEGHAQKLQDLLGQQHKFTNQQPLYQLLETMLLFQLGRYEDITMLQVYDFETQVGIGLAGYQAKTALEKKDYLQARSIWIDLHEHAAQHKKWEAPRAEIASTYLAEKNFRGMAKQDSHVDSSKVFQDAFLHVCELSELVDIANDIQAHPNARAVARYEALSRAIHANDFKTLHRLFTEINEHGEFSAIQTAARMLATNPNDPKGLMNLGFFALHYMRPPTEDFEIRSNLLPDAQSLAQCPSSYYHKQVYGPLEYFGRVAALHDETMRSEDEAKALHHIVMCEKPGQRGDACLWGHHDVELLSGKQAFRRLHRKYAGSEWADKTPYYYRD